MIRTFLWLLYAAVMLIIMLPFAIIGKLCGKGVEATDFAVGLAKRAVLGIAGLKCDIRGEENLPEGAVLYVPNHQSMWDVAAMLCYFGGMKGFIAKEETRKIPIAHLWLENLRCVYINRDSLKDSLKAINEAQKNLEDGYPMVVFPEGTRSKGPEMGEFKPGALRCAIKAGVPVVPVAIDGTYRAFETEHHLCPARAKVSILPPIETAGKGWKTAELSDLVRSEIQAELERMRAEEDPSDND